MKLLALLPLLPFITARHGVAKYAHANLHERQLLPAAALEAPVNSVANAGISASVNPSLNPSTILSNPTAALPLAAAASVSVAALSTSSYWLENIAHQGVAAFNPSPGTYQVFRNVKDYGAKGDGVTDDTAAINRAMSTDGRCGPNSGCQSTTVTPAIVYFPSGTYRVSSSIVQYYFTQIMGDATARPTIKAFANFTGLGLIDGDQYGANGLAWNPTNVFFRQLRNVILDATSVPLNSGLNVLHWPTSQATSIQNVDIIMTQSSASTHVGMLMESGSGGFFSDVSIVGGRIGLNIGNQQFTIRNLKVRGAVNAVNQLWNWGFTYVGLQISDCTLAYNMTAKDAGTGALSIGQTSIIDSTITNCATFVESAWSSSTTPTSAGSLTLENVALSNVRVAVKGPRSVTYLAGSTGSLTIRGWGQGLRYTSTGPVKYQGSYTPATRPASLVDSSTGRYYTKSKPQYQTLPVTSFVSARSLGCTGDGSTDDTAALQAAINTAVSAGKVLFVDHGSYVVTSTIVIPPGARIVGESYPVILARGSFWGSISTPIPVIQVGSAGQSGSVEWSDMVVGTQGPTPGAILIQWNLKATRGSGMWEVHTRIGGYAGSNLQLAQCPSTSTTPTSQCIATYMSIQISAAATGAYLENCWFWTADHDIEDPQLRKVTIYTGRGMLVQGSGTFLYGTGVEHHGLYNYQFLNTREILATVMQSETPYWMPTPDVRNQPYHPTNTGLSDPTYPVCYPGNCDAFGFRVVSCSALRIYGAGFYSFFSSNSDQCSRPGQNTNCQSQITSVLSSSDIFAVGYNTVRSWSMLLLEGVNKANASSYRSAFADGIGYLRL